MSPNQPLSANPRSVSSQQPATPNIDNMVDVKPILQNSLLAMTPSNENQQEKTVSASPRPSTSNSDPSQNSNTLNQENKNFRDEKNRDKSGEHSNTTPTFSLKRPILCTRDYENIVDDDYVTHEKLYDYSTWEAW
jgi:hypothetical protein